MSLLNNKIIIDSNIFLDVIGGFDNNDSLKSKEVLKKVEDGIYKGIVIAPCLTEVYYKIADKRDDLIAKQIIKNILSMNNLEIVPVGREESLKAGRIWSKYNKGKKRDKWLSIVDCLIISIASLLRNVPILTWDDRFNVVSDAKIINPTYI